ncbi:DUF4192 family protein, partial [Saccharomonospora iraqiensis]|uniref:DUF4192 family protein n=1 Tax=Saccharomonospora iraqiensis TaxID=52698 RepID=UPI000558DC7B
LPSGGARAAAAERLWLALSRNTPAPHRARPLTLLAYSAYVRGEGVLAGMALSEALEADPEHVLAQLLSRALDHALPPDTLARLATTVDDGPLCPDEPPAPDEPPSADEPPAPGRPGPRDDDGGDGPRRSRPGGPG